MRTSGTPVHTAPIGKGWSFNPLVHCRRAVIGFAQGLFAGLPVGDYKWSPDIKKTAIVITDANPIGLNVIGQRPAINCVRSDVRAGGLAIDDFLEGDLTTGKRTHTDMFSGNLVINCLSENGYVAEDLAWFLASHIWILRINLLRSGFHDIGRGITVSAVSPSGGVIAGDSDQTWRRVSLILPFHFQWTASIEPPNDLIKEIELHIDAYAAGEKNPEALKALAKI